MENHRYRFNETDSRLLKRKNEAHWNMGSLGKVEAFASESVKAQNHSKGHSSRRGESGALISDEVFWFRFFDGTKK